MVTIAALGMAAYGVHEIGVAVANITGTSTLEGWAIAALFVLGALLVLAGLLVRLRVPGALAAALGSLLGLQGLALHNVVHLSATPAAIRPHVIRAAIGALLVSLAWLADRRSTSAAGRSRPEDHEAKR